MLVEIQFKNESPTALAWSEVGSLSSCEASAVSKSY